MPSHKQELLERLQRIEGLAIHPSKVAGGVALSYRGKEFAHFHSDSEIDLHLTRKVIRELGLKHPAPSVQHPKRGASSHWIEVQFHTREEVRRLSELVEMAVAKLPT